MTKCSPPVHLLDAVEDSRKPARVEHTSCSLSTSLLSYTINDRLS